MYQLKNIICIILIVFSVQAHAQKGWTYDEVNTRSYALYEKADWDGLLSYGEQAIQSGQDFTLLRLRMGYAAFMLNNFSQAINQYDAVLTKDSYNSTAHYYLWLCRKYLNQAELAGIHLKYFTKEALEKEGLKPVSITGAGFEASFKTTDATTRGNTFYGMAHVQNRFGWNIHMDQAGAFFNQTIQLGNIVLPVFPPRPPQPNNVLINQKEYYNKITANLGNHLQLKAAYHYTNTPIGNVVYNNHSGFVGVKYNSSYFDVQADAIFSKISDSSISQYDATVGIYPLGNLNLYSFSTAILRSRPSGSAFNFRQIIGCKVLKSVWLEANATLGSFNDLLENDALYIYNAIDKNRFKAGLTGYISITPKCTLELGYTLEQRELYKQTTTFNQHSITGGLSWKF